jgi:UDP-N-acetylmuramoyl-tripeptide--D-alanyl-D-alanine ligase
MAYSLNEVAAATGGVVVGAAGDTVVQRVVIDSREAAAGALFVALSGEHADGHDYAEAAIKAGAVAILAGRNVSVPHVRVTDPLAALGALAAYHRRQLTATVVGVTGSAGKTGTKDLLAALLGKVGPTVAPPGSYNNDIGLPLTVLSATGDTRFLVLEMGARGAGDIDRLCAVAAPEVGVVLNVGSAHLGKFGSREAIARAKGELAENASALAVLNAADPLVAGMANRARAQVQTFAVAQGDFGIRADVVADQVEVGADGRPSFRLRADGADAPVSLRLVGAHHVANAAAAATVALTSGMSIEEVAEALSSAEPVSRWRMEVSERADGVTVVNDAYNANPESMRAALDALTAMSDGGRRRCWAVLGQMLELGESSEAEHIAVGQYAAGLGAVEVVTVDAPEIADGAGPRAHRVSGVAQAAALLEGLVSPGDIVLVKASRGARLERVADALLRQNDAVLSDAVSGELDEAETRLNADGP